MGCSSSKRMGLEAPPMARSQSMPVRRRKEYAAGEHTVALTSSTLGSIKLDHELLRINSCLEAWSEGEEEDAGPRRLSRPHSDLSLEVFQARTWSNMMEGKIPAIVPRTPVALPRLSHSLPLTPPEAEGTATSTPEMINAWELMEGLEDSPPNSVYCTIDRSWPADKAVDETVHQASPPPPPQPDGCVEPLPQRASQESLLLSSPSSESETDSELSPAAPAEKIPNYQTEPPPPEPLFTISSPKHPPAPLWERVEFEDTLASEFDMDIISDFKKSFQSPTSEQDSPLSLLQKPITEHEPEERSMEEPTPAKSMPESKPFALKTCRQDNSPSSPTGLVKARVMQFQTKIDLKKSKPRDPAKSPPDSEGKVVFYFTSLRGVRKTFDDCCRTRLIFKGYDVKVDERDVSMHQRFRLELDEVLNGGGWTLPRVFVKGKHVGGAEDVRRVHETGELEKMLEGCPRVEEGRVPCVNCGDIKFVHCYTCSGSCKVFCEVDGGDGVFERCPDCNENGIIRCPVCCV